MKQSSSRKAPVRITEHNSIKLLMHRMGMSKKEVLEVNNHYGVSASKLLELMQMSKYPFVYTSKPEGQCDPCSTRTERLIANRFIK